VPSFFAVLQRFEEWRKGHGSKPTTPEVTSTPVPAAGEAS
jgi:hypothetical protein